MSKRDENLYKFTVGGLLWTFFGIMALAGLISISGHWSNPSYSIDIEMDNNSLEAFKLIYDMEESEKQMFPAEDCATLMQENETYIGCVG